MAALTADTTKYKAKALTHAEGVIMDFDVAASTVIYKGGFVGLNAAGNLVMYASATVGTSVVGGHRFCGIALEHIASQTAAGDKKCAVLVDGCFEGALGSATILDQGAAIYASDDNTLTQTAAGNRYVGSVLGLTSSGVVTVKMDGYLKSAGPLIYEVTAAIPSAAANIVNVIHTTQNPNGLWIVATNAVTVADFGAAAVITLQDTAATTLGLTFTFSTASDAGELGLVVGPTGVVATQDLALVVVPAGLGVNALVTTTTANGSAKIAVLAAPIS